MTSGHELTDRQEYYRFLGRMPPGRLYQGLFTLFHLLIPQRLSTLPTDVIQSLLPNLSSLPAQSVTTPLDDGILLERVSPYLTLRFACRPSGTELASLLANLLAPATNPSDALNAVLVYSGLLAHGTGYWILPDFVLTPTSFVHQLEQINLSQPDVTDVNGQQSFGRVHLHVAIGGFPSGGEWRQLLSRRPDLLGARTIQLAVNTNRAQVNQELNGTTSDSSSFSALDDILQKPSLRALRLSLYIFPEGSGQSSILTLPGYSMLINAGHSHRPNCWPVLSYLDRLDSVFVTHWGVDNVLGMNAVLPCVFAPISSNGDSGDNAMCLLAPPPFPLRIAASPDVAATATSLSLNIPRLVSQLLSSFKQTGVALNLHTLSRGAKVASPPRPLRLYQKVGQGTLEAHVLTPADDDTTELRHATNSWMEALPSLTSTSVGLGKSAPASKVTIPLLSYISVSAIIVWRPARETEPILRILLVAPNAHQTRVLVSLESIVAANIYLRHQRVSMADFDRKHSTSQTSTRTNGSSLTTKTSSGSFTKATPGRASTLPQPTQNISHQLKPTENKSMHYEEKLTMGLSANLKSGSDVPILEDDNQTKYSATAHGDQGNQSLRYTPDQPIGDSAGQASVLLAACHTPPPDELVDSWGVPQFLPPPVPPTGTQTTTTKRPIAGPRKAPTTARSGELFSTYYFAVVE
ncbi:unnamed protein product [Dicrocoelium dendriticum]|nr:unnamed protein product [Dicrocoelium dendriticum]